MTHREERFQQVKAYQSAGQSKRWVAKETGLSRNTVSKYWGWPMCQAKTPTRYSPISRYETYLRRRWAEGQQNVKTLHLELQQQGYPGAFRSIYRFVSRWLRQPATAQLAATPRPVEYAPRQVSMWLSKALEDLPSQLIRDYVTSLLSISPLLEQVRQQVLSFKEMMTNRRVEDLDGWLGASESLESEPLRQFVRGLRQDYAAVRQAFSSVWSNGQVEGQVNRLKTIKRQMYGRASFELLRRRVVLASG